MKKYFWIMAAVLFFLLPVDAQAAVSLKPAGEMDGLSGQMEDWESYDFSQVEQILSRGGAKLSFGQLVEQFLTGDSGQVFDMFLNQAADSVLAEIRGNKEAILQVFLIAAAGALFSNFAAIFQESQIAQTAFFIAYLLMLSTLSAAFGIAGKIAAEMIEMLLEFMKALIPAFFLSVAFVSGSVTSMAFYQMALLMIVAVEWGILYVLIPLVYAELLIRFVNDISGEDVLSKTAEVIHTVVQWGLKTMMGLVLGIQLIQGLILPFVDAAKTGGLQKALSFLPGIGSGASTVSQMVLGSGILIKNGIGAAALVAIIVLAAVPVLKLAVICLMYRLAAAVIQPVSDKRMVGCVSSAADGVRMLLKIALAAVVLFFITIALVCSFSNAAYYGG